MASLEEILSLQHEKRAALLDPATLELDPAQFEPYQLGLRYLMVDPVGRFWDVGTRPWRMIFDPHQRR
jgi:hypothetical protein